MKNTRKGGEVGMRLYRRLIRPAHCYPGQGYEPKTELVEKEEKWYPEEEREHLEEKYGYLNEGHFSDLIFEEKYEPYLLKEQEAKVLTVDQLEDALDTVVWLETPVSQNLADGYSLIMAYSHMHGFMFFDSPFGDNPSQDRLEYSEYGKSWRCWDKRPYDEQRKAVKWE